MEAAAAAAWELGDDCIQISSGVCYRSGGMKREILVGMTCPVGWLLQRMGSFAEQAWDCLL
jgi:hypothetical protein